MNSVFYRMLLTPNHADNVDYFASCK